jgi:hypothetical protein
MNFKALLKTTLLTTLALSFLGQSAIQARKPRLTQTVTTPHRHADHADGGSTCGP